MAQNNKKKASLSHLWHINGALRNNCSVMRAQLNDSVWPRARAAGAIQIRCSQPTHTPEPPGNAQTCDAPHGSVISSFPGRARLIELTLSEFQFDDLFWGPFN